MTIIVRPATHDDAYPICAIYNAGIRSGLATFETQERHVDTVHSWLSEIHKYPLLVAEAHQEVIGFAKLSEYRPRECYRGIAEFSIYLSDNAKGKGTGAMLLGALLDRAKSHGFSKVLSRIFTFNHASLALCKKLGFREVGVYERHGQLNGKWLDVVIVEKNL